MDPDFRHLRTTKTAIGIGIETVMDVYHFLSHWHHQDPDSRWVSAKGFATIQQNLKAEDSHTRLLKSGGFELLKVLQTKRASIDGLLPLWRIMSSGGDFKCKGSALYLTEQKETAL